MKKILSGINNINVGNWGICVLLLSALSLFNIPVSYAAAKFDIIPELPEPLSAQASTVSTGDTLGVTNNIGAEPNLISVVFSLLFVILLIYATGIIYTKLNKLGFSTMKKQMGETNPSKATVVSTTSLGNNRTLHVVELDGKRMLIGVSQSSIHLIKDLGSFPPKEIEKLEYSNIEIPNIRIPKIEIPKIEFPNIGFTKTTKQSDVSNDFEEEKNVIEPKPEENLAEDDVINNLFNTEINNKEQECENEKVSISPIKEHQVDPDEYALYKKYL